MTKNCYPVIKNASCLIVCFVSCPKLYVHFLVTPRFPDVYFNRKQTTEMSCLVQFMRILRGTYTDLKAEWGRLGCRMSLMAMMLSCLKCLRIFSSRKVRLAFVTTSKALDIFFIATCWPVKCKHDSMRNSMTVCTTCLNDSVNWFITEHCSTHRMTCVLFLHQICLTIVPSPGR